MLQNRSRATEKSPRVTPLIRTLSSRIYLEKLAQVQRHTRALLPFTFEFPFHAAIEFPRIPERRTCHETTFDSCPSSSRAIIAPNIFLLVRGNFPFVSLLLLRIMFPSGTHCPTRRASLEKKVCDEMIYDDARKNEPSVQWYERRSSKKGFLEGKKWNGPLWNTWAGELIIRWVLLTRKMCHLGRWGNFLAY